MLGELRWRLVQHVLHMISPLHAHNSCLRFYLDKQRPLSDFNASVFHYEWVDTWIDFYNNEPTAAVAPGDAHLILGGEAAMWAEQVCVRARMVRACARARHSWLRWMTSTGTAACGPARALLRSGCGLHRPLSLTMQAPLPGWSSTGAAW